MDLGSVDDKIEWANYHIRQLDTQIRWFLRSKPYAVVEEDDPDIPGNKLKVYREYKALPTFIPLRIGDCCHNLRGALDHLVYRAVPRKGAKANTDISFPILRELPKDPHRSPAQQYRTMAAGKVKGASKKFVDANLARSNHTREGTMNCFGP